MEIRDNKSYLIASLAFGLESGQIFQIDLKCFKKSSSVSLNKSLMTPDYHCACVQDCMRTYIKNKKKNS